MKKPFAWVSQVALGTSFARPGALDCLPHTTRLNDRRLGSALVVQRSGKVRGSSGRDHRVLQKNHAIFLLEKGGGLLSRRVVFLGFSPLIPAV